jgi:hypothetical protein
LLVLRKRKLYKIFDDLFTSSHILATKKGLFKVETEPALDIQLLMKGEFFGISRTDTTLAIFEKVSSNSGKIYVLDRSSRTISVINDLSPGIHQIRYHQNDLYVTDTYDNSIKVFDKQLLRIGNFYPNGVSTQKYDKNYAHLNSISFRNELIYLMAHNSTKRTGRKSEILICDLKFEVIKRISTGYENCHDIVWIDNKIVFCATMQRAVIKDNRALYTGALLSRGLKVYKNQLLIGGSEVGDRRSRRRLKGSLTLLDLNSTIHEVIETPGMVQDIC